MCARRLSKNWISTYAESMEPLTEAPTSYMIWSAISVISAVLKKKVWVDRGAYNVYPNQYIVLVGPPGVGKGTAIHPAHAYIKDHKPQLANYISDRVTAERIIQKLAEGFQTNHIVNGQLVITSESSAVIQATELSTFLGSSDWMTSFLCDTWDKGEFEHDTKNKGTSKIKDMCVSLIGACVPDFIRRLNGRQSSAEAINGGFTARTIFVFANEPSKRLAWPMSLAKSLKGQQLILDLRHDLERIAELQGEYTFTKDAADTWEPWYKSIKQNDADSDVVRHFKSRQHVHVLKVAICLAASQSDVLQIDRWALVTAMALVKGVLDTLDITFRGVGESSLAEATAKVQSYIERKGLASRAELVRDNHRHATIEDMDRIITTLITIGLVEERTIAGRLFYQLIKQPIQP